MSRPYRVGDQVTVVPTDADPILLHMQRYATVSAVDDGLVGPNGRRYEGVWVTLDATIPPGEEFGPIRADHLIRGWRNDSGRWRHW